MPLRWFQCSKAAREVTFSRNSWLTFVMPSASQVRCRETGFSVVEAPSSSLLLLVVVDPPPHPAI